jgi:hypothetical protein
MDPRNINFTLSLLVERGFVELRVFRTGVEKSLDAARKSACATSSERTSCAAVSTGGKHIE